MLILPEKDAKAYAQEQGMKFVKDRIIKIAQMYKDKLQGKLPDEFWIMLVAKPDMYSGKINTMIKLFDKANKPEFPIQGGQMWRIVWSSGLAEIEWILPLQRGKVSALQYSQNNLPILNSLERANKVLGGNLLDENPFKRKKPR